MTLFVLNSSDCASLFGTPDALKGIVDVDVIAQRDDCSAFLVLSNTAYPELTPFVSYEGFTFSYCQSWGLTINDEVVARVIRDLRAKAYPPIADYVDAVVKDAADALAAHKAACLAVKLRYPKAFLP